MMHAAAVLLALCAQADKKDVWMSDYKLALQTALQTGKPLVIDAGRAG